MKNFIIQFALVGFFSAIIAFFFGEQTLLAVRGAMTPAKSYEDLSAMVQPAMVVKTPAVASPQNPAPVLIQMHGCGGMNPTTHEAWAERANDAGYMAVIVDSHAPRNIDRDQAIAEVCTGKALIGQERAADILAAVNLALSTGAADPDQIYLAGWSHGAWTIMDFLTMGPKARPTSLKDVPGPWPEIKGALLFYPYCGLGARTRVKAWSQKPDILALIAGQDTIVDHKACRRMLSKLSAKGVSIEEVFYPEADHAFDNPNLPEDLTHWYRADDAADAAERFSAFLRDHAPAP